MDPAAIAKLPPSYFTEYNGYSIVAACSTFIGLMIVTVALRFWAKHLSRNQYGWDDWLMIPSLVCGIAAASCCIAMVNYGGAGYHLIVVYMKDPNELVIFSKLIIAFATFYLIGMTLPKISMLCMFLRIFVEPWQRKACYVIMAVLIATSTADVITNWMLCTPLPYLWDKTIPGGHCIDVNTYWRWGTFPNIITDILMILLPIPAVFKIQLSWKDKIGVLLTFMVGGIGLIASILRFAAFMSVDGAGPDADSTYASTPEAIYSILEITVYIATACLPSYRGFWLHFKRGRTTHAKPSVYGSSQQSWRKAPRGAPGSRNDEFEVPLAPYGHTASSKFQRLDNVSEKSAGSDEIHGYEPTPRKSPVGISVKTEYKVTRGENRSGAL